jgi:methyl acetate hydrolase
MTLGEYFEANIFQPLGLKNTTFDPRTSSDMMNRLTGTHYRQPDGSLKCESNVGFPYAKSGNCNGGGGLWSTANDFCQILQSAFLRREGQQQILSESTANEICQPCLRNPQYLEDRLAAMKVGINLDMIPHVPKDDPKNFGLGVVINLKELETGLSANSGQWSGFPNCYWVSSFFISKYNPPSY